MSVQNLKTVVAENHPVIGVLEPDGPSLLLGTGYSRFAADCGIDGLAKIAGKRLDILALYANAPRAGQFREFIRLCKLEYSPIAIWAVESITLREALRRYGFTKTWTWDQSGAPVSGWRWEKD